MKLDSFVFSRVTASTGGEQSAEEAGSIGELLQALLQLPRVAPISPGWRFHGARELQGGAQTSYAFVGYMHIVYNYNIYIHYKGI